MERLDEAADVVVEPCLLPHCHLHCQVLLMERLDEAAHQLEKASHGCLDHEGEGEVQAHCPLLKGPALPGGLPFPQHFQWRRHCYCLQSWKGEGVQEDADEALEHHHSQAGQVARRVWRYHLELRCHQQALEEAQPAAGLQIHQEDEREGAGEVARLTRQASVLWEW
jgi:hypothetical protein